VSHITRIEISEAAFSAILSGRKRFNFAMAGLSVGDTVRFEAGSTPCTRHAITVTVDWIESAGRHETVIFSFTPHNRNFLVSSPNDATECYGSIEEALEAAKDFIDTCRPEYPGDSWHDETDNITISTCYPRVLWRATAVNVEPVMEPECDEDGNETGNEVDTGDFNCDYEMKEET
jgi:hypothetical protein